MSFKAAGCWLGENSPILLCQIPSLLVFLFLFLMEVWYGFKVWGRYTPMRPNSFPPHVLSAEPWMWESPTGGVTSWPAENWIYIWAHQGSAGRVKEMGETAENSRKQCKQRSTLSHGFMDLSPGNSKKCKSLLLTQIFEIFLQLTKVGWQLPRIASVKYIF